MACRFSPSFTKALWAATCLACLSSCSERPGVAPLPHPRNRVALFEDVTAKAGLNFVHTNGATGKYNYIEFSPPGCALFDYDGDGWLDVLLIQSGSSARPVAGAAGKRPTCRLYRNNRDGTFTDTTAGSGLDRDLGYAQGIAVGDYDNDGFEDVFITAYGGNHLLHNEAGSQTEGRRRVFSDVTRSMGLGGVHSTGYATSAAFGDYDNDGRLDLFVCYYSPWTWSRELECNGPGGTRDYCTPEVYPPDSSQLLHNEGSRFRDVSGESGIEAGKGRALAAAFIDFDHDGRPDIFVANDMGDACLWHNDGRGRFSDRALEAGVARSEGAKRMAGMGIAIADYDRSGRQSVFVTNFADLPNVLFRANGQGRFEDVSAASGVGPAHGRLLSFGCEFLDYDLDGWPDIVTANGHVLKHAEALSDGAMYAQPRQLLHNEGNGRFTPVVDAGLLGPLATRFVSRGLAVGDFDNDGRPDILVANQNGPPQLLRNLYSGPNHGITLRLIGSRSNRDALMAHVTLKSGGTTQSAMVRAGSSYLSHSDTRLHFGLGTATTVDEAVVQWPSGARSAVRNLPADRILVIKEGAGLVP